MRLPQHRPLIYLLTCLLAAAAAVGPGFRAEEECLQEAWKAFKQEKYQEAIRFADKCIDDFRRRADKIQASLDQSKEPVPKPGKANDEEKTRIFSRGLLNDVAAAYFIKGRSAEHLYQNGRPKASSYKEMAEQAYKATCRYKHGLVWDQRNKQFWSPCEEATLRLPLD